MGSSPVTATTPLDRLLAALADFLDGLTPGAPLLVAFSGGPDSCALLWGLHRLAPGRGFPLHAAHYDHRLDPDSAGRAERAALLCSVLRVPLRRGAALEPGRGGGLGPEAEARRGRYRFLEAERERLGAQAILTAHHLDDQAETVLLRMLYGSGLQGLAGIQRAWGWVRRPLLGLRRADLDAVASRLAPTADPTNENLAVPRNLIRRRLLPHLSRLEPGLSTRLAALAETAAGAAPVIERRLQRRLRAEAVPDGAACDLAALRALAPALRPFALGLLHRLAHRPLPPRRRAQTALFSGLAGEFSSGDCGGGWRWRAERGRLLLEPTPAAAAAFTYTFSAPGSCVIPELGMRVILKRVPAAAWMWQGSSVRAGFSIPSERIGAVVVRSRRPGDRLQPLGGSGVRRLKEILVDRKVPRPLRDRLPLLCLGDQIVWVPGLTVAHPFRLREHGGWAWEAALEPA